MCNVNDAQKETLRIKKGLPSLPSRDLTEKNSIIFLILQSDSIKQNRLEKQNQKRILWKKKERMERTIK